MSEEKATSRDRTSIMIDRELEKEAADILGTKKTTETINAALSSVVREKRLKELWDLSVQHSREMGHENLDRLVKEQGWRGPGFKLPPEIDLDLPS